MHTNSIDIFPWNDNFETGLPKIDEQHRKLVQLLNSLANHVTFSLEIKAFDQILDELAEYAVYHFNAEEAIWHEYLADDPNEAEHHLIHQSFIQNVSQLKASLKSKPLAEVAEDTLGFMAGWLASHILKSDRYLAYVVLAKKEGLSLEAAKLSAKEQMSDVTQVLINIILSTYSALSTNALHLMRELSAHRQDKEALLQARQSLQKSEAKYRALVETTDTGFLILDNQNRVLDANAEYVRLTGHQRLDEILGRNVLEWTAPYEQEKSREAMARCLQEGSIRNLEIDYLCPDGQIMPIEINATVQEEDDSLQIISLCRDISERRQIEKREIERAQRLKRFYESSLKLSGEPDTVFRQVVQMIAELFAVRVVCLSEIVDQELNFLAVCIDGKVTTQAGSCPLDVTPCATVEEEGDLRIYDSVADLFPQASFLREHQALSYCGFPSVSSEGKVIAVTCLLDDKPHKFTEEDQQLLRIIGQRLAMEIERNKVNAERQRAIEALRQNEEKLRTILDSVDAYIYLKDVEGRYLFANRIRCRNGGQHPPK